MLDPDRHASNEKWYKHTKVKQKFINWQLQGRLTRGSETLGRESGVLPYLRHWSSPPAKSSNAEKGMSGAHYKCSVVAQTGKPCWKQGHSHAMHEQKEAATNSQTQLMLLSYQHRFDAKTFPFLLCSVSVQHLFVPRIFVASVMLMHTTICTTKQQATNWRRLWWRTSFE